MTRPTTRDLADAHEDLETLAYAHDPRTSRNNTGFPDVAALANILVWYEEEIKANAPGYGPGVKDGYHILHRGGNVADLDARTRDQHQKDLKNGRADLLHQLGRLVDESRDKAMNIGRYPTRTEQVS